MIGAETQSHALVYLSIALEISWCGVVDALISTTPHVLATGGIPLVLLYRGIHLSTSNAHSVLSSMGW